MRMVPDIPHGTNSQAEKRVFDRLRNVKFGNTQDRYTVYHSLNLTGHAYKRWGEIDFLICGPNGLYAIEVKGGRVSCEDGVWYYTNRDDKVFTSREGPFKQAESALHGLRNNLKANLPEQVISQFSFGFGVICPDCELNVSGTEWDSHTIAGTRGYKDLDRWLEKLFQYWRDKDRKDRRPDRDALKAVQHYLRPNFEAVVPLHAQSLDVEERIAQLTEDQLEMVDVVTANRRVMCSGGAGTGKTFLAVELARRWTANDMNVLLACRSSWLKNFLEARFAIPKLTISTIEAAETERHRAGLDCFDALIVDEGQDMFDMDSLDKLDSIVEGGLESGCWCFFHDINNQAGLLGTSDQDAIDYLHSFEPARVPLRTNCRNTKIILDKVQSALGADMGARGAGQGPRIREHHATSNEDAAIHLMSEISELIDRGMIAPGNVTILSPVQIEDSCVAKLPGKVRNKIASLDEYSVKSFPDRKINFAMIRDFKGLENEAIVVVDLPPPDRELGNLAAHYVAMSRARSVLSLIYQKQE